MLHYLSAKVVGDVAVGVGHPRQAVDTGLVMVAVAADKHHHTDFAADTAPVDTLAVAVVEVDKHHHRDFAADRAAVENSLVGVDRDIVRQDFA